MANTPLMNWGYPDENARNWYDDFTSFANAQDADAYAAREDRSIFIGGGGALTFDSSTSTLSWPSNIIVFSPIAGYQIVIASSSLVVADGSFIYFNTIRLPSGSGTAVLISGTSVPNTQTAYCIGARIGTTIYFKNGAALPNTGSVNVFSWT